MRLGLENLVQHGVQFSFNDILTIVAFAFTVGIAIYQTRRAQSKEQAEREVRHQLRNQMAAEHFSNLERDCALLFDTMVQLQWDRALQLATNLGRGIAAVKGAWSSRISIEERTRLDVAGEQLTAVSATIPIPPQTIDADGQQRLLLQCRELLNVIAEISARLKYDDSHEARNVATASLTQRVKGWFSRGQNAS